MIGLWTMYTDARATSLENWVASAVRFTEWPTTHAGNTWTVCQPSGERALLMDGLIVRERAFRVLPVDTPRETGPCDVFVSVSLKGEALAPWLLSLHSRTVLSIGLGHDFCTAGGALCVAQNSAGRNAFLVNRGILKAANLRASAHLPVHLNINATSLARVQ